MRIESEERDESDMKNESGVRDYKRVTEHTHDPPRSCLYQKFSNANHTSKVVQHTRNK